MRRLRTKLFIVTALVIAIALADAVFAAPKKPAQVTLQSQDAAVTTPATDQPTSATPALSQPSEPSQQQPTDSSQDSTQTPVAAQDTTGGQTQSTTTDQTDVTDPPAAPTLVSSTYSCQMQRPDGQLAGNTTYYGEPDTQVQLRTDAYSDGTTQMLNLGPTGAAACDTDTVTY